MSVKLNQKGFFMAYTKEELLKCSRDWNVRAATSCKKAEIAEKLKNEMLIPSTFRKMVLRLQDSELALFRKLCKEECWYIPEEDEWTDLYKLADAYLVFIEVKDRVAVASDVKAAFAKADTEDFRKKLAEISWFRKCLYTVVTVYGSVPVSIFLKLFARKKGMKIEPERIQELLALISDNQKKVVFIGDRLISTALIKGGEYQSLEIMQKDKGFYIPGPTQVEQLYEYKYPAYQPEYMRYAAFIEKEFQPGEEKLFNVVYKTYRCLAFGGMISDVVGILNEENFVFSGENSVREFADLVVDLSKNTRMTTNCGFTPNEMAEKTKSPDMQESYMAFLQAYARPKAQDYIQEPVQSTSKAPVEKIRKIYPNDPCPCGSGKKYKKCCGRK